MRSMATEKLSLTVNGEEEKLLIEPRKLLSDVIREDLHLTGTKRGCGTGKCGACTVLLEGEPVKSCSILALQAEGQSVTTVEGLGKRDELTDVLEEFWENLGFQCDYYTPGLLMTTSSLIEDTPSQTEAEIREYISGNICRCTGYVNIVSAVKEAAVGEE